MQQPEPVDRATRMAAAEAVCRHVLACYGEEVLGVAIYGSVARGDDGPYSDVEMMVVTTPAISPPNTWVFENGVLLDVAFVSEERLVADARKVASIPLRSTRPPKRSGNTSKPLQKSAGFG